jgi:hypothetical protein
VFVHLVFLGAPAIAFDFTTHSERTQLQEDEAADVIAWRKGGAPPAARHVRRRANIVFPGANRPSGPLQQKVAEFCDTDEPPFRKNFLVLEADAERLTITPYRVTGEADDGTLIEDAITVPYAQQVARV